jgi:hypothetical protein
MRIPLDTQPSFRLHAIRLIVLSGTIALAACEDTTAPEETAPTLQQNPRLAQAASSDLLASLSSNLDDMTGWSLAALPDGKGKANIVGILNGLKGHLNSGRIDACQQDVTDARAILGLLTEVQQVEVGHVGLALDVIQAALDGASK